MPGFNKIYRDECFDLYLKNLVEAKHLPKILDETDDIGSVVDYQANGFVIRLVNERGLASIEVAMSEGSTFFHVEGLTELIQPENKLRLSLEDQVRFLEKNWDRISELAIKLQN